MEAKKLFSPETFSVITQCKRRMVVEIKRWAKYWEVGKILEILGS